MGIQLTKLPAIVGEGLVGFRHAMYVFSSFYRGALPARCIEQLTGKLLRHALTWPTACGGDQPAHRERDSAVAPDFHRHLIRRATYAARLDLEHRRHIAHRLVENVERVRVGLALDAVQRLI